MTADEIIDRMKTMIGDRSNFSARWQDCADYGMPGNNQITNKHAPGAKRVDTFQTVGENCIIQLAAGLYSYMFPTDSKAFALKINNEKFAENEDVKQWLHNVTDILHLHMIQSNFREAFFELLKSLGLFGTGCFQCEKGLKGQVLNFINFYMGEIYIDVDSRWNIDTVFRQFEYTARQAEQEFGRENLGEKVSIALDDPKKINDKFKFIYATYPRKGADGKNKDPLTMDYEVKYVSEDDKKIVKESGTPELSMQVSRFDRDATEKYGRSPMMKMLSDIQMLSEMKMVRIKAWEKMCDPPIVLPDDGSIWPLATQPGGVIHKATGGDDPFWFEFKGDLNKLNEAIDQTTKDIKDGFFISLFELPEQGVQMTATEVIQRAEQKMRTLTPIIGRLQSEYFNPMIHRMIRILGEAGVLPVMPEELMEAEYSIEYLGRLALALKSLESQGFIMTMDQLKVAFGELDRTEYLDNFDIDKASRNLARNNGVPATWLKNEDTVKAEREQQMKAAQQQAAMEQLPGLAKAAADAGKAPERGSLTERTLNAA